MLLYVSFNVLSYSNGQSSWSKEELNKLLISFREKLKFNFGKKLSLNYVINYLIPNNEEIIRNKSLYHEQGFFRNNKYNDDKYINVYLLESIEPDTTGFYNRIGNYCIIAKVVNFTSLKMAKIDINHRATILLHEIGHAIGLDHVNIKDNVMNSIELMDYYQYSKFRLTDSQKKVFYYFCKKNL